MIDWNNKRPALEGKVSALGIGKAIYAAPDGDKNNARLLLAADGFHFRQADFSDFEFNNIVIASNAGRKYSISFDENGQLLINGLPYITPTNQSDETIAGNKEFTNKTKMLGGLQLVSSNGTVFSIDVDDDGSLHAEEVKND